MTFPLTDQQYMGIYAVFGILQAFFVILTGYMFAYMGVKSSSSIHDSALTSVFRAPIAFFDTTPVGRIMNRFSKDVDSIDNVLPETLRMFLNTLALTVATVITIVVALPWFLIPLVLMLPFYWFAQAFYRSTSREIKRLDSVSRSPLYAHFAETLNGLATIRAYSASERFELESRKRLDKNNRAYYMTILIQRWLAIRLETTSAFLVLCVGFFSVASSVQSTIPPGILGLVLSYSLSITATLNWCVRQAAETEVRIEFLMAKWF
jgi:ATP-binding cassette subfamily C (CFTR/MRP) protein 1